MWKEREEQRRVEELNDLLERFASLCGVFQHDSQILGSFILSFFFLSFFSLILKFTVDWLSAVIYRFSAESDEGNITLDECRELFHKMQTKYFEEYRLFKLEEIAISSVLPLVIFSVKLFTSIKWLNIFKSLGYRHF